MHIDSLEDALAAVARVGPVAREHAQKAEDERAPPVEVASAMADAGLWRAFTPKAVGGAGLIGLVEQFEIVRAMAYEDTSAAWGPVRRRHVRRFAGLPAAGREEVFAGGVAPIAGAFNPADTATPVPVGSFPVQGTSWERPGRIRPASTRFAAT